MRKIQLSQWTLKLIYRFFFVALFFSGSAQSQTVYTDYVDSIVYVKLQDTCSLDLSTYTYSNVSLNNVFSQFGVDVPSIRKPFPDATVSVSLTKIFRLKFTDITLVDSLINHLTSISIVEYAEKEPITRTTYVPNDINTGQWQFAKVNAFQAWDITHGSGSVIIAIVDNAIRITHSDLSSNIWTNAGEIPGNFIDDDFNGYADDVHGYDVADGDGNPNPPSSTSNSSPFGHGTHCAGIASASTDNNNGIASLGFNTKIMAVKCASDTATGSVLSNAYDGVYYAIRAHANIISMSWGSSGGSFQTGQAIMNSAHSLGIVLIAAAGNDNTNTTFYPAAFTYVIAVGATDQTDFKASFSNYGSYVDVMAPGTNIYSTLAGSDNSYGNLSGTSMATPLVAGLAALVKANYSNYTPDQIESAIKSGCDNIDAFNAGFSGQLGAGRINAYRTFVPSAIATPKSKRETFSIKVYPNPAGSMLHINYDWSDNTILRYRIENILGQTIKEKSIELQTKESDFRIDITDLVKGVYFLYLMDDENIFLQKIIKY